MKKNEPPDEGRETASLWIWTLLLPGRNDLLELQFKVSLSKGVGLLCGNGSIKVIDSIQMITISRSNDGHLIMSGTRIRVEIISQAIVRHSRIPATILGSDIVAIAREIT